MGEGPPGGGNLWDLFFTTELSPPKHKLLYWSAVDASDTDTVVGVVNADVTVDALDADVVVYDVIAHNVIADDLDGEYEHICHSFMLLMMMLLMRFVLLIMSYY